MIPVLDLFAGPGGLSEGFASLRENRKEKVFRIALSIEMEKNAHRTLWLRSFFRQFQTPPEEYYDLLRGTVQPSDLYRKYRLQARKSRRETWRAELGKTEPALVDERIRAAIAKSKFWVAIGGPPCQAYSLAGRSRVIPVAPEKYERDHRHFLYREYLRIIAVHRPAVFVMENVKGILSSKVHGQRIIDRILADLREPLKALPPENGNQTRPLSYNIYPLADYDSCSDQLPIREFSNEVSASDYIVRCEAHGIPQARHRLILVGVRHDLTSKPSRLSSICRQVPLLDAINDLPRTRSCVSKQADSDEAWKAAVREACRHEVTLNGNFDADVYSKMTDACHKLIATCVAKDFVSSDGRPKWNPNWFFDKRLKGVCNHSTRRHRKDDLWRYLFASCYAAVNKVSPRLADFPSELLPAHNNVNVDDLDEGEVVFDDRFRVQLPDRPATTITSHISKDGHYFIHPDPRQCRSLTVREAARLQTFPDNYFFTGRRTSQYQQVGNAVPPLLAAQIAQIVYAMFLSTENVNG